MKHRIIIIPWVLILYAFSISGNTSYEYRNKSNGIDTIENFNDGNVLLQSYPGEDFNPTFWSLENNITFNNSPFSLKLFGNTWKTESINPIQVDSNDIWQVAAYIQSVGEIHGFGVFDSLNSLFYSFSGTEKITWDNWKTVYQGAFSNNVWNKYLLAIGSDWLSQYGYLPRLKGIVFVNDKDNTSSGTVYFDEIWDITNIQPIVPKVCINYEKGEVYLNKKGNKVVDIQFRGIVNDSDSQSHQYLWNFGDDSTSTQQNPFHTFIVTDDHEYTVLLKVTDETNLCGSASCNIIVDGGPTTFPLKMNFVGDLNLARGIESLINTHGISEIFNPTLPLFGNAADISVINLECVISNTGTPHPTKTILLRSSPSTINALTYAGVNIANLANNHILDYGLNAFRQTQSLLASKKIVYFGVGANLYEAMLPGFYSKNGVNIGFVGSSDRTGQYNNYQPYLNAGFNKPGFADLNKTTIVQQINSIKGVSDLVVFVMHSGSEYSFFPDREIDNKTQIAADELFDPHFRNPTESDIEIRHFAIDKGADAVICHHPHIIHPFEVYKGKLIAHSLGNFIFDLEYAETYPSVILNSKINSKGFYKYSITPLYIKDYIPVPAKGELGLYILDYLANGSRKLNTYVKVNRDSITAEIILDTILIKHKKFLIEERFSLKNKNGIFISNPIELKKGNDISEINSIKPQSNWYYRLGRQIVWFGNFENEGSLSWNLDNADEWYDTNTVISGKRSLCQKRTQGQSTINTDLKKRIILHSDTLEYSLHGLIKTSNSNNTGISIQFYNSRTGSATLGSANLGLEIDSTTSSSFYSNEFSIPASTQFINVRLKSEAPGNGTAYSWFDNVGVIEWDDWISFNSLPIIQYPNDYYWLQLKTNDQIQNGSLNYIGTELIENIISSSSDRISPDGYYLYQNYPNPFNPTTTIEFCIPRAAKVELKIFNLLGEEIKTLINEYQTSGKRKLIWNGRNNNGIIVSSGIYFYQLKTDDFSQTKKLLLIK